MRLSTLGVICALIIVADLRAQEIQLPSDPLQGRIVFEEKGCMACHAIEGFGGTEGPDLGRAYYYGGFTALAATLWNHIPQMDRKYRQLQISRPRFTQAEMLDLSGFLYYLRYLGEPGSVARGKKLLASKGCTVCHGLAGRGGRVGPRFEEIRQNASPLFMAQAMWNHGPSMQEEIENLEVAYPTLTGQDIVDISVYLQMATIDKTQARMAPGNPVRGRDLFREKRCQDCHAVRDEAKKLGPNLSEIDLKLSVTEIAGLMWNHSPVMFDYMREESIEWPRFEGSEMADLIAYLYFLGFEDKPGDPQEGEAVFIDKDCALCHEGGVEGPDLAAIKRLDSPVRLAQLMWNHAPEMEDLILVKHRDWPKLTEKEMRDLYAFLKTITQE